MPELQFVPETTQLQEAARLQAFFDTGVLSGEGAREFDDICARARSCFKVDIALVTFIGAETQFLRGRSGTELLETPRHQAFCNYTIQSDAVFVVPDTTEDARFADYRMVVGPPKIRFYAGAPLTYLRGIRLGALCLLDGAPRDFTLGDQSELEIMADEVVSVIASLAFDMAHHLPVI